MILLRVEGDHGLFANEVSQPFGLRSRTRFFHPHDDCAVQKVVLGIQCQTLRNFGAFTHQIFYSLIAATFVDMKAFFTSI
jgi:hypothetical protein